MPTPASRAILLSLFVLTTFGAGAVGLLFLCTAFFVNPFYDGPPTLTTESVTLPTGEIFTHELTITPGFQEDSRTSKIYFQPNAAAPSELLAKIDEWGVPHIDLHKSPPRIFRGDDRLVLVIGVHVFKRVALRSGYHWDETKTLPHGEEVRFLATFLKPGPGNSRDKIVFEPYAFDHVDFDQNLLVTRRESRAGTFPQFLVYSSLTPDPTWRFDLGRTRAANGLPLPADAHYTIDISVVTCPGQPPGIGGSKSRDTMLATIPGAKEVLAKSLPLNGTAWTEIAYSFNLPDGTERAENFEAIFNFADPSAGRLSVSWRPVASRQTTDWHFIEAGVWERGDASGLESGLDRVVFFRVRAP